MADRHAARRGRAVLGVEEAREPPQHRRVGAALFLLLGGLVQPRYQRLVGVGAGAERRFEPRVARGVEQAAPRELEVGWRAPV